jgi:hypothetical protein
MQIGAHPSFELSFLPAKGRRGRTLAFGLMVLGPLLYGLLALALGQDANWDFRNYHWYNAYAALNGRMDTLDLLPSQTPFFYNPALDIPFYLLATHLPARGVAFLLGVVQGLNFPLLMMLAHAVLIVPGTVKKVVLSALIAGLGVLGGGGIAQIGTTFYDNVTSLGLFLSLLLVLRRFDVLFEGSFKRAAWIALGAGVPAGLVVGLKLPCAVFAAGLCAAPLFVTGTLARRVALGFFFGLGVLAGVAVTLGPWMVFLDAHFQNPLFPYFNNFFHSPLAAATSARDTQFVPLTWHDRLLFPLLFARVPFRVGEIPWTDIRLPLLYLLLPFALVCRLAFGRSRSLHDKITLPLPGRFLIGTVVVAYGLWLFGFAIYRYALPLEMLTPLVIVVATGLLPLRLGTRALVAAFLLIAVAGTIVPGNWTRRDTWLPSFQEVHLPPLPNDPALMILMAGFEPYAHLVPALPPRCPVVRIQSNFSKPEEKIGMNERLAARLAAHQGRFMLLIPRKDQALADKALKIFHLRFLPQTCQEVRDDLYPLSYALCDVRRSAEGAP